MDWLSANWFGLGVLVLLWMIMSRVQDSLVCLRKINDRLESNQDEARAMQQHLVQQSELVEVAVNNIGAIAEQYEEHYLRPLKRRDEYL